MNPKRLQHFLAIADAGSLSRAAERLEMSQPALSRELRALEAGVGLRLLRRHAKGVALTDAGQVFKRRAQAVLDLMASLGDGLDAAADEPVGRLAFGMPVSMGGMLTGPLVARFREAHPQVRLHVREAMSAQLHDALLSRDLDVAVLAAPVSDPQLTAVPFLTEPMMLVGPASSKLSAKRPVAVEVLAQHPLILPAAPHSARFMVESALAALGRKPTIAIEADIAPLSYFISRELGYSVVPSCAGANMSMVAPAMKQAPIKGLNISWVVARPAGVPPSVAAVKLQQMLFALARERVKARTWNATLQAEDAGAGEGNG